MNNEKRRKNKGKKYQIDDYKRGYGYIYNKHILQAENGCDFDFLLSETYKID